MNCECVYRKFNTCKKSACMQTMGGGGSEGADGITIHQLHQRSKLIMLSHNVDTWSDCFFAICSTEVQWLRTIVEY